MATNNNNNNAMRRQSKPTTPTPPRRHRSHPKPYPAPTLSLPPRLHHRRRSRLKNAQGLTLAHSHNTEGPYIIQSPQSPRPVLHSNYITRLEGPSPALKVNYTFSLAIRKDVQHYTRVSVWHVCNTRDPFSAKKSEKKSMEFTSMVSFRGSYCTMSLQGAVAVMQVDDVDLRLTITGLGSTRAVPSSSCRFFKEYLFAMDGEIFLAFLIHRESLAVVDGVEVLRLDLVRMDWVKVERLRGKTVFLKERCIWVDSEEFGCGDDRVYFVEGLEKIWKVFDMKNCCISPVSPGWSGDHEALVDN